jgi:hypothetical protein
MTRSHRPARLLGRTLAAPLMLAGALCGAWQATAHAADCQSWTFGQPPSPGTQDNELNGVAVLSACDAWAAGTTRNSGGTTQTLIEHWDGSSWTVVPSPSPGTTGNGLASVRALSPTDIWAVGVFSTSSVDKTLILHWNGTTWQQVPSPSPGAAFSELSAVTAVSASDAWAAGDYSNGPGTSQTLILHWNGTAWTKIPSPHPGSFSFLAGVAATSAGNAWAAGERGTPTGDQTLILHWNGTTWPAYPPPPPQPATT